MLKVKKAYFKPFSAFYSFFEQQKNPSFLGFLVARDGIVYLYFNKKLRQRVVCGNVNWEKL